MTPERKPGGEALIAAVLAYYGLPDDAFSSTKVQPGKSAPGINEARRVAAYLLYVDMFWRAEDIGTALGYANRYAPLKIYATFARRMAQESKLTFKRGLGLTLTYSAVVDSLRAGQSRPAGVPGVGVDGSTTPGVWKRHRNTTGPRPWVAGVRGADKKMVYLGAFATAEQARQAQDYYRRTGEKMSNGYISKTGAKGVYANGCKSKPYTAQTAEGGRVVYLGMYATIEEAVAAREEALAEKESA